MTYYGRKSKFADEGQQMYGEARFTCTVAMLTGNLSPYQKTYQYR